MAIQTDFKLKGTNIGLDFDSIKQQIKEYLSSQSQFADYNFDSSGMSVLMDVLAYNSQMNAMTAHLSLNEVFLDSAQARPNIVSLAKQLGYTPKSVTTSTAVIDMTITPISSSSATTATLKKHSIFNGGGLDWFVTDNQTVTKTINGKFEFKNIILRQGTRKVIRYYFDPKNVYEKFEIPDRDVDINTISVRVRKDESSTVYVSYSPFSAFSSIDDDTPVYFIEENAQGLYEIYFTGGNVGVSPEENDLIEIEYFYSVGEAANGINVFSSNVTITSSNEMRSITTVSRSSGGQDKEDIESIRFNAPHFYEAQNRCVTFNDYAAIIKKEYSQADSINVWGGEDNTPAEYGRVFICIKPKDGDALTQSEKDYILTEIVGQRKVATIQPRIVDPEFTYVGLEAVCRYDENKTINSEEQLVTIIKNAIEQYSEDELNRFDGVLRYSKLLRAIDNAEFSIQNSTLRVYLVKKITLSAAFDNEYQITIPSDLYDYDPEDSFIKSSVIYVNGIAHYITDRIDTSDANKRQLVLVYANSSGAEIVENVDIGYIDINQRTIYLYGIRPDVFTNVSLYINPKSNDIVPRFNQLVLIDPDELTVEVQKDYIRTLNSIIPDRFNATPKHSSRFER